MDLKLKPCKRFPQKKWKSEIEWFLAFDSVRTFRNTNVHVQYLLELVSFCDSFPLISRYLAGNPSNSDSEDEDGVDDDDDEPEDNSNRESEVERSRRLTNPST